MGAWIEILFTVLNDIVPFVAPHMGAWIEIGDVYSRLRWKKSRTPHGCVD